MVFGDIRIYQNNHTISLIKYIVQKWKNQGQIIWSIISFLAPSLFYGKGEYWLDNENELQNILQICQKSTCMYLVKVVL